MNDLHPADGLSGRLALVLASIDDHLVCYDREWRYRYVNDAATRVLGRPAAELLGACIWELFPDAVGNEYYRRLHEAVRSQRPVHFEFHYEPFGRWFDNHVYPSAEGVTVFSTDVTDRKLIEQDLEEKEVTLARERERLALALRAGRMGVYEWRVGDEAVWWSPEIFSVYGVDPASFRPTLDAFVALVHPDDRAELLRRTQACIESRQVFVHEYRVVWPDGSVHWVANRSVIGMGPDGTPERITGVAMDVSERRLVEDALRESERRKDQFLAVLSHELRNPLAPIRTGLELLARSEPGAAVAERTRHMMERQVRHMVRLVDDLLDISRITSGKLVLRKQRADLVEAVRSAVEACRGAVEAAGHRLQVRLPAHPMVASCDAVRITQVASNLLNNAAKYTSPGGSLSLALRRQADAAVLEVEDDGPGIPPQWRERVFEPFVQVPGAGSAAGGGLGLGLALARDLVALHGGTIELEAPESGRGCRFVLRIPLVDHPDADAASPAAGVAQPAGAGRLRALVVDDNRDAAETLGWLLQAMGHDPWIEPDGEAALLRAAATRPDVVILDLGMPRMDGFELARLLRERCGLSSTPLIALTGYGQEADRIRTRHAGFAEHLVKPVDPGELSAVLQRIVAQQQAAGEHATLRG